YRAAHAADDKLARALWGLALIHGAQSLHKTARQELERAFRQDPDDPDILLSWAHAQPHVADEVPALQRYLRLVPALEEWRRAQLLSHIELLQALHDRKTNQPGSPYENSEVPLEGIVGLPGKPPI